MELIDVKLGEIENIEVRANIEDYNEIAFLADSINRGNGKYRINLLTNSNLLHIKKVIFNKPATIVLWEDGTKTVVKCQDGELFDAEKGLALCFMKKVLGNKSNFNNIFKRYIKENEESKSEVEPIIATAIWIDIDEDEWYEDFEFGHVYKCSNCGYEIDERPSLNYCPRCGCKMHGHEFVF